MIGPLGNTFSQPAADETVYLVGGGVGVAPLYFLALKLLELPEPPRIHFCMGARTGEFLQGIEDFRKLPIETHVATNDGSEGFHGFVTDLFLELWKKDDAEGKARVYGCGPQGMNESLRNLSVENGLDCEICLESMMGCGFGICFGCCFPTPLVIAASSFIFFSLALFQTAMRVWYFSHTSVWPPNSFSSES